MKKNILINALLLSTTLIYASGVGSANSNMNITSGWQMKGSEVGFSTMQNFNQSCIDTVWSYDTATNSWRAYSPDNGLATLIQNSATIATLSSINPDDGFWVKANSNCLITKEGNITEPTVIYQTDALWPYATPLTLNMLANKSFKAGYEGALNAAGPIAGTKPLTFDENGFANINDNSMNSCANQSFENNISLNSDGVLVNKWRRTYLNSDTNETESYSYKTESKLLASDASIGYVLVDRHYDDYNKQYQENVSSMIFDNAVENPIDMATKLPYTVYDSWNITNKSGRTYDTNRSITHFDKNGVNSSDENFSIEDGKIVTSYDYNDSSQESHNIEKQQIVFEIGDFDILKHEYAGTTKNKQISYSDENNSWTTLDLNASITTFYDIFQLTHNKIYDDVYDLDNGTISNPYATCNTQTFSISDDGKTLTSCYSDGYCYDRQLQDGAIVDSYSDSYYETIKTTPYF